MAFPTTYSGWITYIRDWLAADEYSDAQIASFLDLAQLRLNREMESYGMEAVATITVLDLDPIDITAVIADFNKVRLVSVPGIGPLTSMAINEIKRELETKNTDGNPAQYFCIDAGKLYTYPKMSDGTIDLFYYRLIPYMSKTPAVDSNVFSTKYQDALLYAGLLAAAPYMKDTEFMSVWSEAYAAALITANNDAKHIKLGSTPLKREVKVQ